MEDKPALFRDVRPAPGASRKIRPVTEQDAAEVAQMITEMLTGAPLAFGERAQAARARTPAQWQELVRRLVTPGVRAAFLAEDELGPCGFVAADAEFPETPRGTVVISRLWVAPRQRRRGLAHALMEAATHWALDRHASHISLGVTEMNVSAREFYRRLGYRETGMQAPWPQDPAKRIIILSRKL